MSLRCCPYIYNPVATTPFTVYFDPREEYAEQEVRARGVIQHLHDLPHEELVEQSIQFYKWIVLYIITDCNIHYAERLLAYFHKRGLLLCKRQVNNEIKQTTQRYLVIYTIGTHVFSKTYNSIREIQEDTGRRPSQIKCQHIMHLHAVKLKNT